MAGLRAQVALERVCVEARLDPTNVRFLRVFPWDSEPVLPAPRIKPEWVAIVPGSTIPIRLGESAEDALANASSRLCGILPPLNGRVWNAGRPPQENQVEARAKAERARQLQRQQDRELREAKERRRLRDKAEKEAVARAKSAEKLEREAVMKAVPQPRRRAQATTAQEDEGEGQ